ncbi:MAG: response regulator transcription factor [Anaerolineales bacterium]|nr:response regulator transcription factor [Anaerolineales bacterium]
MEAFSTEANKIRVLVVDDHDVVRVGLCALIAAQPDMVVIGEATDGEQAIEMALSSQPDVILMDLVMPKMGGTDAIVQIKQRNPSAQILVLTSFAEDNQVYQAVKSGALGYLLKNSSPRDLIQAIRQVNQGEPALQPSIALKVLNELHRPTNLPPAGEPMTPREVEVLQLVARGLSNQEIALQLNISDRTAAKHVCNILDKLHLANRTQAALYALREGLASLDDAVFPT